ncbi:hypothetical protein K458DRAFT_425741 [Lentithecium fluviatile CBS 122367]|uniref:DUF3431 domain-containing protein n=1 Tax=Lentithecium fluviatile CBS 122367 TaxID=1168545 RepID=A0A6G1JNQ4_9PLEO|nr:hypothetical protein K458DRAFT_425741 [Lentithecium fluviatile CBS 122367]
MAKRNLTPILALTIVALFFFIYSSRNARDTWRGLPQHIGLGDGFVHNAVPATSRFDLPNASGQQEDPDFAIWNPKPDFKPGSPMPPGHNYTSTLVIAKVKDDDTDWMEKELPDQVKAIYVADDPTAPLHPPKNKGHEVMIYLSWIIDNYNDLPDVAIFMHAHQLTWHNDDILGHDAANLINRLSRQRVWREGFVNMRCSWNPGCPDWMHPGETEENAFKREEVLLAKSWSELFPLDEVPQILAQPCCAQFALSRERIHAKPHAQYLWYREWLFSTRLPDYLSGRIWEYVWQFVFTGENVYCPKEHICFCDQFGSCFGGEEDFEDFLQIKNQLGDRERELREWEEKRDKIKKALEKEKYEEAAEMELPEEGKDREFRNEIDRLRPIVDRLKEEALERGMDPQNRAKEAGREWQEGDGF